MHDNDCEKINLSGEQINALSLLDKEISILLIKKLAIISEALGTTIPASVSGPIDRLVVDTSKDQIPPIRLTSFKKAGIIEIEFGDIFGEQSLPSVCHDADAGVCCTGDCPC